MGQFAGLYLTQSSRIATPDGLTSALIATHDRTIRTLSVVLLAGLGLLALGALSLWTALDDAEARAQTDARRAATAVAAELRKVLRDAGMAELATPQERFAIAEGDVVVPPTIDRLVPLAENPRAELSGLVAASIDALDREPAAATRLRALLPDLDQRARGTVLLALAWHAQRREELDEASVLTDQLEALALDPAQPPLRSTTAGLALLRATRGEPVPPGALDQIARGDAAEATAVAERLRELGANDAAARLGATSGAVGSQRTVLGAARALLGVLEPATDSLVMAVRDRVIVYRPGAAEGALLEPLALVERLRARAGALSAPWSGTARRGTGAEWIDVVPGVLAIEPDLPMPDRSGPIGLLLVLAACAAAFVGGLWAVRSALLRERAAMRLRSEFLTSVTHELRTPIAAIRLLAERLSAGRVRDDARRDEYHAMLASEATRLGTLVENVLDLGRMDRGERSYDKRETRVSEVVEDTARVIETFARAEGLDFAVDDRTGDTCATIDRGAIQQALLNLCDNARKYGRGEGGIELCARIEGAHLVLSVRDHGPGVPEPERERIFERFVRGNEQTSGAVPGVGLGLNLARVIATAHGGSLVYHVPEDGPGAMFVLSIPLDGEQT